MKTCLLACIQIILDVFYVSRVALRLQVINSKYYHRFSQQAN